jgi:hypothetical protein
MTLAEILTYALAALGSIAAVANAVSLFAPKGTALGDWAAWFASMPLTHKPIAPIPKLDPPKALPVIGLLVGLGAAMLTQGCSLESARYRRAAASPLDESARMARSARPVSRCQMWDSIHVYGDWSAGGLATTAAVAGGLAVQTESRDFSKAMAWTALGTGAASAVIVGWASQSASSWTEAGCGK